MNKYIIDKQTLEKLLNDSYLLFKLEAEGVDCWDRYCDSLEEQYDDGTDIYPTYEDYIELSMEEKLSQYKSIQKID